MRRKIIGSLFLITALLVTTSAGAATTCLCVGTSNAKACGFGAIGGNFLMVSTSVSSSRQQYYLSTVTLRAQLNGTGKAYDATTGWLCWNGSLQQ